MIHGINQYRGVVMISVMFHCHIKIIDENKAHMMIVGYILLILRLYQLINPSSLP